MVSKVAVMALVAVLAVPILLGYGLNLTETSVTEYKPDKETVNITQFLQNGTAYSFVHADSYKLNTDLSSRYGSDESPITPRYNSITTNKTPYNVQYLSIQNLGNNSYAPFNLMDIQIEYGTPTMNVAAYFTYNDNGTTNTTSTYQHVIHIYFDRNMDNLLVLTIKDSPNSTPYMVELTNMDLIHGYYTISGGSAYFNMSRYATDGSTTTYPDISKGYYFPSSDVDDVFSINLPIMTSSALMTINLDSITANNYNISIGTHTHTNDFKLVKRTTSGVVSWEIQKGSDHIPLYYDQSRNDNTYQIKFDFKYVKTFTPTAGPDQKQYELNIEFRYAGSWPISIGESNYYQKYNLNFQTNRPVTDPDDYLDRINLAYPLYGSGRTPTIRMDDALFAGFSQPAIVDNIYDPASFKTNPSTTINNISRYGDSIGFADQMYQVGSDGNITIGTRSIPVNGIIMESVPMPGGYENKINGYVISTSNDPSPVRFYGTWLANITTDSQTANSYNTTVWNVGEFAWDGIDTNFLMVGLITCLGVFVGLGIYLRKTKSSMWPLLIVCGCAAGLFFCMI